MVSTNLAFRILATDDGASKVMSQIGASSDHLHGRLSLLSKGSEKFGSVTRDAFKLAAGAVVGAGLIEGLKSIWEEAERSALVTKQTEAAIRSTGGAAHVTAGQVGELAQRISEKVGVDDEAIQSGENLLLTFCLEDAAQALTKDRGWVGQRELWPGDEILTYDPADRSIRWDPVDSVHRFAVDSPDMVRWQSKQIDVLSTPTHRWWTVGQNDRASFTPQFRTTEQVSGKQVRVLIGGGIPACFAGEPTYSDELIELAGWIITEGWVTWDRPSVAERNSAAFSQSATANPEKVKHIRELIRRLGAQGHRISEHSTVVAYNGSTMVTWSFARDLGATLRGMLPGKKLTMGLIARLTREQAALLLNTLIDGDGHTDSHGHRQYIQKDRGQLDVLAALCSMLGIRTTDVPSRSTAGGLYLNSTNHAYGQRLHARRERYNGIVWCPHVRTGVWLARVRGRTFWTGNTGIRNEAGKGNDIFNQATRATVDMTAAMNGGIITQETLSATSIRVGRALNDPIKGMTALTRAGVTFTDQQKSQVATMVKSGDTLGAQKVILRELSKEFGGSAEAAATGAKRLGVVINNIKEDIGKGLVRAVDEAGNSIADQLPGALAAASKAFGLIEGPIVRIGTDLKTIFIPLVHDGAAAVKPLALLVGGTLVVGLRLLADVLDFVARHEGVFVPLTVGALAFVAASKSVTLITSGYKGLVGILETAALKAMYARDGMKALAAGEDAAKLGAFGLNLALGAAALVVGALAMKHMQAKQAQDEHNSAVQSFSAVLRDNNGAINANVTAQRAAELEQKGLLDLAGRAGINLATYTQATLGNADAQRTLEAALHAAQGSGKLTSDQFARLVTGTYDYVAVTEDAATGNIRLAEATTGTAAAGRNMTAEQKAAAAAIAATKEQSDALWSSLTKLANINLSAMSASLAMQAAIIDVDGSLKGLDGTTRRQTLSLAGNTAAGNAARQTLIQHLQAALADGEAQKARGVKTEVATRTVQADIAALRQHYLNLGYNKQAVDEVIAGLQSLGKQHPKASASVDTSQANRALDLLNRKLTTLDGRTVSTYTYNFQQDIVRAAGGGRTGHAGGGLSAGWSWFGERGPELGYTPDTTAIFTAEQSRQMIASFKGAAVGGGTAVHIEHLDVHLDAVTGKAAALEFVQEVKALTRRGFSVSV